MQIGADASSRRSSTGVHSADPACAQRQPAHLSWLRRTQALHCARRTLTGVRESKRPCHCVCAQRPGSALARAAEFRGRRVQQAGRLLLLARIVPLKISPLTVRTTGLACGHVLPCREHWSSHAHLQCWRWHALLVSIHQSQPMRSATRCCGQPCSSFPFAPAHSGRTAVLDQRRYRAQARIISSALVRMRAMGAAGQRGQLEWHTHTRPALSKIF